MALNKGVIYAGEATREEHDDKANVELKKVGLYGWDSNTLTWNRISADATGQQTVTIDPTGSGLVVESTPLAHEGLLDDINTGIASIPGVTQQVADELVDGSQKTQVVDSGGANIDFAKESGGNLATIVTNTGNIPTLTSGVFGQAIVAVTGTAVQLGSNALENGVIITALSSNASSIKIGGSGVTNVASGSGNGYILEAGGSISVAATNTNVLYINGTAGDIISFMGC